MVFGLKYPQGSRNTMCDIRNILNSLIVQGASATHQLEYMKLGAAYAIPPFGNL